MVFHCRPKVILGLPCCCDLYVIPRDLTTLTLTRFAAERSSSWAAGISWSELLRSRFTRPPAAVAPSSVSPLTSRPKKRHRINSRIYLFLMVYRTNRQNLWRAKSSSPNELRSNDHLQQTWLFILFFLIQDDEFNKMILGDTATKRKQYQMNGNANKRLSGSLFHLQSVAVNDECLSPDSALKKTIYCFNKLI